MADYGSVDDQEHYLDWVVVEESGWVYCGIGTARCSLVAFHLKTRERRQLLKDDERKLGTAVAYLGTDGKAYGRAGEPCYRLSDGAATPVAKGAAAPPAATGAIGWGRHTGSFPDGRTLKDYNLPERWLEIEDAGKVRRVRFDYQSEGALITSLVAGPDGRVYGSSAHPMHFFAYTPAKKALEDWGPVPRIGGGNICFMDVQGRTIVGGAYSEGLFYLYDTERPFTGGAGEDPNPRVVAEYPKEICRPRAALAHPDGKHVLMAGYAGYGMRGGGVALYDIESGKATLLTHEQVIPDQSTIVLKALPNGDLVGGTSIETPGGGHPTEKEAVLYVMDWASRKVVFRTAPVPGAPEIPSLEVGADGLVYGLASGSKLFVFDPKTRKIVHQEDLSQYGGVPRPALLRAPGGTLYAPMSKALLRIEPRTFRIRKLADLPGDVSTGAAIHDGRLYFAIGSHLWSTPLLGR